MTNHFTISISPFKVKRTACGRNNRGFLLVSTDKPENVDCGSCGLVGAARPEWISKRGRNGWAAIWPSSCSRFNRPAGTTPP